MELEGRAYCAILIPTAPIPVGGGLLYVPQEWIRAADMGVDQLTSIYVSMGLTPPSRRNVEQSPPVVIKP